MPLAAGRLLLDSDDERAPRAALVNETFVRTYLEGDGAAIGRRFRFVGRRGQAPANAPSITIVGVVRDVREDGLDAAVRPQI